MEELASQLRAASRPTCLSDLSSCSAIGRSPIIAAAFCPAPQRRLIASVFFFDWRYTKVLAPCVPKSARPL